MSATVSPVAKPFRPQFTLRRLLVAIFLLGIALGIGRWVYVTVVIPRQIVAELRSLGAECHYVKASRFVPHQRWTPGDPPPIGYKVHAVYLRVPFQSDDEAKRSNHLLRQLPPLGIVRLEHSKNRTTRPNLFFDRLKAADRHVGIALREVPTTVLVHFMLMPGEEAAAYCRDTAQLRSATFQAGSLSVDQLRKICQAPQLEELSLSGCRFTEGHLAAIETAPRLQRLQLKGLLPFARLRAVLGNKPNCELELSPYWIDDLDLREHVATLPNLRALTLDLYELSDEAVVALADAPNLRELDLSNAAVTDAALMALARSKSLQTVNLCGTEVSDEAICKLAECPTLRRIDLYYDRAEGLPPLPKNVQVESVYGRTVELAKARAWRRAWRPIGIEIEREEAAASRSKP